MANDVDVRLSLQRVRLPWATLSDVAVQVMAKEQRLDLSIANAGMYRGAMKGRMTLERTASGISLRTQMTAERIDLGVMSADVTDSRLLSGTGTAQYQIESSGRTALDLITNASGRLAFTARNGDFAGTNLNDVMRRVDRQPLAVARDWRGGRTSFDQASFTGILGGGSLTIGEGQVSGTSYRLALEGRISLLERLFRVEGHALSVNGASQIPFEIVGPLLEPSVQVNARVLLERSGAAAPLIGGRAN
jgi:AsmA protein